jgi:hypothetical protein
MESLLAPLIGFSMVSITVSIFVTDDMSFKYTLCACTLSTDRRTVSTDVAGGIGMKYSLSTLTYIVAFQWSARLFQSIWLILAYLVHSTSMDSRSTSAHAFESRWSIHFRDYKGDGTSMSFTLHSALLVSFKAAGSIVGEMRNVS